MTFLNEILLLGMAAMAVPLILHLIRRRLYQVVPWGAMHLLAAAVSKRTRSFRLEQLLLVAVRMAILGLLAAAMARPALESLGGAAGALRGQRAVAVVVDASYSLEFGGAKDRVRAAAESIAASLDGGDTIAIVAAATTPRVVLPFTSHGAVHERGEFGAALESIQITGSAQLAEAISEARSLLARADAANREIFVISDSQAINWLPDRRAALREILAALHRDPRGARIAWVTSGGDTDAAGASDLHQPFLGGVRLTEGFYAARESIEVRVGVVPRRPIDGGRVTLGVDGVEFATAETGTLDGAEREVIFRPQFETAGSHWLEARLDGVVGRPDTRSFGALVTRERMPVLIVDGAPRAERLKSAVGYLQLALDPYAGRRSVFDVRVARADGLTPSALDGVSVVVLANVRSFEQEIVAALEGFVVAGGGLVVFCGDRVDPDRYNTVLFRDGKGLLPAELLVEPPPAQSDEGRDGAAGIEIPADDRFGALGDDAFRGVRTTRWLRTRLSDSAAESRVLLGLSNGDPLLIERRLGRGRVVLCTTSATDDWSNLPLRPIFLPFIQDLVLSLGSGVSSSRTLAPGEAIELPLSKDLVDSQVTLRLPDGREVRGMAFLRGTTALFEYRDTSVPGLYVATVDGEESEYFAVTAAREESDLTPFDSSDVRSFLRDFDVELVSGADGVEEYLRQQRYGVEIWTPLVALVLTLAILELLLARWIERVRRSTS